MPKKYLKTHYLAWIVFVLPLLAGHFSYLISLWQQVNPACIPYLEGCVSISRAARNGDAIYFFRALMLPQAGLLIVFWIFLRHWLSLISEVKSLNLLLILITGVLSSVFLILYVTFLGSEGEVYRYLRRYGVTFYFGFALLAQLLATRVIHQAVSLYNRKSLTKILTRAKILVLLQLVFGLTNIGVNLLLQDPLKDRLENQIEWFYGILMVSFYAIIAQAWKRTQFKFIALVEEK